MGKIQRFPQKIIIRLGAEEILSVRVVADRNISFTLQEMVRWYAATKATEKQIPLPGGVCTSTFDKKTAEFVVTFADDIEHAI